MRSFHLAATVIRFGAVFGAECYMPLDVVFVQDTTGTMGPVLPTIVDQLSELTTSILLENPNSRFGLAQFRDKPFYPLGIDSDFCYDLRGDIVSDTAVFHDLYAALDTTSGGDLPDAQYHALINSAQDPNLSWRDLERPTGTSGQTAGAHVIVLVTDSEPHLEGDVTTYHAMYPESVPDLPSYPETLPPTNFTAACVDYDYPSPATVGKIVNSYNVAVVFLTPNNDNITPSWRWVNDELLLQPAGFYQTTQSNFSDFKDKLIAAIELVTRQACATPLPVTTSTSTSSTADSTSADADGQDCVVPCPPAGPCCRRPNVLIDVNNNPKKLTVNYEK